MTEYTAYRFKYRIPHMYQIFLATYPSIGELKRNRASGLLSEEFVERLMLAVTEVNGCALCSYAHAKMALELGLEQEEITSFLSGSGTSVAPEEARAILFAQSYADDRGVLDQKSWEALVSEYGLEKSRVILAAARGMMTGNIIGLPWSALIDRFKGKPYTNSSLGYELVMILAPILLIPLSALHHLFNIIVGGGAYRV